jgi:hypothetical protein
MTTPHDEGRPDAAAPQPTPPAAAPEAGAQPDARPAPRYGQYAPAGWQQPGTPVPPVGAPVPPAAPGAPSGPWGGAPASPWGGAPGHDGAPVPPGYGQQPVGYGQQAPLGYGQQPPAGWQQPVGAVPPGAPVPPGYGYAGGPYQQPAYQPGIVPLRPLSIWEIFDGAFRAIRANPKTMFGLTAGVVTVVVALSSLITWYVSGILTSEVDSLFADLDPSLSTSGSGALSESLGTSFGSLLSTPLLSLATTVLTGLLILSVSRSVIGRTASISEVLHGSGKRLLWIIGFALLSGVAVGLASGLLVAAVVGLAASSGSLGLVLLVTLGGGAGLIVLAVWLTVRTLLVPPALMLEGGRFWASVARAWRLTRGSFWRLLGLYLLVQILGSIVSSVVTFPAAIIANLVTGDPTGTSGGALAINAVAMIIALTLTTVFSAGVIALAYIDARMRREGLDVELARAAGGAEL